MVHFPFCFLLSAFCFVSRGVSIFALPFRVVQPLVGAAHQIAGRLLALELREADRDRALHRRLLVGRNRQRADARQHALGHRFRAGDVGVQEDECELLPAAAHHGGGRPHPRTRSATAFAPVMSVCRRMTANSSPPKRTAASVGRSDSRTAPHSSDKTTSPITWPRLSLICLKSSMSNRSSDSGTPNVRARSTSCGSWRRK